MDTQAYEEEHVYEEIQLQLVELDRELEMMQAENDVYENFYRLKTQADPSLVEDAKRRATRGRKKGVPTALQPAQKCDIVNCTLEELQKEAGASKKKSEKLIDSLRAILEETDLRIAELKKEAYEFKRDIVVGAENMRTGKTLAEKVMRYMEDKLKAKDQIMEKLRLKNSSLKASIAKADHQLNQKEEMGDILHYIDFHQLQIENKQHVVKIEDLNDDLFKLKLTTGRTIKALSKAKNDLDNEVTEAKRLEKDLRNRQDQLHHVEKEHDGLKNEMAQEKKATKKLNNQAEETTTANEANPAVPQILDYVAQKAELYQLTDAVKNWKKKVELMENHARKLAREQRAAKKNLPSSGGFHQSLRVASEHSNVH